MNYHNQHNLTNNGQQNDGANGFQRPIVYFPTVQMPQHAPSAPPYQHLAISNRHQLAQNTLKRKRNSQLSRLEAKVKKMEDDKKIAEEEKCKEVELAKLKKVEEEKRELEEKIAKLEAEKILYLNQSAPEPPKDKTCVIS